MSPRAIFKPTAEIINLVTPFLFIPLLLWEYLNQPMLSTGVQTTSRFIAKSIFLNHLHVYFTLSMLLFLPEMRMWIKKSTTQNSTFYFWKKISFVCLFFFIIASISDGLWDFNGFFISIAFYFIMLYSVYHAHWQFYGLARLYDKRVGLFSKQKIERIVLHGIFLLVSVRLLSIFLFTKEFNLSLPPSLDKGLFYLSILLTLFLVYTTLRQHQKKPSNKIYYIPRFFIIPLLPDLFFAQIAMAVSHGIEYLFVFMTMTRQSEIKSNVRIKLYTFTLVVCTLGLIALSFRRRDGIAQVLANFSFNDMPPVLKILASFSLAITLLHFYLDSKIFNFSTSSSKDVVMPLLASKDLPPTPMPQ